MKLCSMWRVGLIVCSGLLLAACTITPRPTVPVEALLTPAALPTPAMDGESAPMLPPSVENGAVIYAEKCAACHGESGAGDGPQAATIRAQGRQVPSLIDPARARVAKPSEWHAIITVGRLQNLMPGFASSLTGQQRWDVLAYVWALGTPPQRLEAGRKLYAAQCASCHGPNGELAFGNPPRAFNDMPFLASYSLQDLADLMQEGEAHAKVRLSGEERHLVADVVRSFGYLYADPAALREARLRGDGTLTLRVVNGTPGGRGTPIGATVVLRAYDTRGEVFTRTAQLDVSGWVTFTALPRRSDYFYQAELDYAKGRFYAPPLQFSTAATATTVLSDMLPIFETTEDESNIRIAEMHFFVQEVRPRQLTVVEIYQFDNLSDRAYIGKPSADGRRRTLRLSKPAGAQNLRFDGLGLGQRFFEDGDVIFDTDAVVPGRGAMRIIMLYEVPYRDRLPFERKVFYPVDRWDVIIPELEGVQEQLRAEGLVDRGRQVLANGVFYLFAADRPAQAGETLRFTFAGRLAPADRPGSDARALGFGLIALGVAIGLAYLVLMRVRALREHYRDLGEVRQTLLRQIARLDDAFAQGKLREADYHEQRQRLKAELREIWE
ncbi:MAG: cytochrome c [Thermoflexales bacterium]|nr:cytochrome c [Thermoflexales bacterium]